MPGIALMEIERPELWAQIDDISTIYPEPCLWRWFSFTFRGNMIEFHLAILWDFSLVCMRVFGWKLFHMGKAHESLFPKVINVVMNGVPFGSSSWNFSEIVILWPFHPFILSCTKHQICFGMKFNSINLKYA